MANSDSEDVIGQLKNSPPSSQLVALKYLKNHIIGHPEKKEILVQRGLVDALVQVLNICVNTASNRRGQRTNGSESAQARDGSPSTTDFQEVQVHALTLLSSLAQGGLAFLYPLRAASVEPSVFASLSPKDNPPRVVCAALKVALNLLNANELNILADETSSIIPFDVWTAAGVAQSYRDILAQTSNSPAIKAQVSLVCQILQKTAYTDQQRATLCSSGILDCLAAHLSSFYIHHHPRSSKAFNNVVNALPPPPSVKTLPQVLGATYVLIEGSRYRVASLLVSPALFAILPFYNSQVSLESRIHQATQYATYDINPADLSVPWIHNGIQKTSDANFHKTWPALGTSQSKQPFVDFADTDKLSSPTGAGVDSALTPWLIHLTRTADGLTRVRAASVLSAIARTEFLCKSKSYTLALLVVPVLLDLMKAPNFQTASSKPDPLHDSECQYLCEAPLVLGTFVDNSPSLGHTMLKHAVEAGVIKESCRFLKQTFATIDNRAPSWSASPNDTLMEQDSAASCTLGYRGVSSRVAYLYKCRRAGLMLLAGIAGNRPGEDKYRKVLVENGAIQCIMDSLNPLNAGSMPVLQSHGGKEKLDASVGNTVAVMLAACRAATAMARSVYLLRTSLIDAGLAKPIYALIQHSDVEVVVAATGVLCNLLVECSPMREDIIKAGAIKTLCLHAKSSNPRIRGISLWATKHLVSQAPSEIKRECIETLDMSWLMQVIDGESSAGSLAMQSPLSKVSPNLSISAASNALGERVSILHTPDDDEHMQDESAAPSPAFRGETEQPMDSLASKPSSFDGSSNPQGKPMDLRHQSYLQNIKIAEDAERAQWPLRRSQEVQAHALDILGNILYGPGQHDMIDYLFGKMTSLRLYSSLAAKLQPQQTESSISSSSKAVDSIPYRTLDSALKTVSNLAAGPPRQRKALLEQSHLLQLILPLFQHSAYEIRVTCCWICTNLMWMDDSSDMQGAKERALTLRQMGFEAPLEELSRRVADGGRETSRDVIERATSARDCMMNAIEGRPARGNGEQGLGHMSGIEARAR